MQPIKTNGYLLFQVLIGARTYYVSMRGEGRGQSKSSSFSFSKSSWSKAIPRSGKVPSLATMQSTGLEVVLQMVDQGKC